MKPDRVVIGSNSAKARDMMGSSTLPSSGPPTHHTMDPRSAELTKYAANAMLATRAPS